MSLSRLTKNEAELRKVMDRFGVTSADELFIAVGYGKVSVRAVCEFLAPTPKENEKGTPTPPPESIKEGRIESLVRKVTGRDGLAEVLDGIRLAQELGFHPIKVNAVIIRGINEHEVEALADFARTSGVSMRFIEFMPLDSARVWLRELVVPAREILARLQARFDLQPVPPANASETARRWRFADGPAEIGLIAPVSEPFCGHCNRLRLTADGQIRTCLFSVTEHDLRGRLRRGDSPERLEEFIRQTVWQKEERHHIGEPEFVPPARSMSCIGG